jgi:hypothetical protein
MGVSCGEGGHTFLRSLIDLLCGLKESHHHVRINSEARGDLLWWESCFDFFHGSVRFKVDIPLPSYVFATYACEQGGGANFGSDWFYVSWLNDVRQLHGCHINELKLYTAYLALKRWGAALSGKHVCIRSDNVSTVSAINKSTSRSRKLMPIVRELFWLCVRFNVTLSASHIAGKLNVLPHRISRLDDLSCAFDARLLLANYSSNIILCSTNMSLPSFIWLQKKWTESLRNCARKQRD